MVTRAEVLDLCAILRRLAAYTGVVTAGVQSEAQMMIENGFSGSKAASVVGISYRQLDYWARTDLIRPSLTDASGSGSRRLYSYRDLLELRVIKSLLDAGIKLESVRKAFTYLRLQTDTDIAARTLVISGSDVLLCDGDELIDIVRRGGQGVLNVLAIGGVKLDLDNEILLASSPRRLARSWHRVMGDYELSPLDAQHRQLGAKMVPFGGWEMPCRTQAARSMNTWRAATTPSSSTCRTSVRCAFQEAMRSTLQRAFTNDLHKIAPGRAQYTHLLDEADASVLDDIIVWWLRDDVFDVMPNASNTDGVRAQSVADDATRHAVLAVQGRGERTTGDGLPAAAAVGRFKVARLRWHGERPVRRRRHRLHGRGGVEIAVPNAAASTVGRNHRMRHHARWPRGSRTRCAWKLAFRCTVTSSAPVSRRCRPASMGGGVEQGNVPSDAALPPNAMPAWRAVHGIATEVVARRVPTAPCSGRSTIVAVSPAVTFRRSLTTASQWRSCRRPSRWDRPS